MTVSELIDELSKLQQDLKVVSAEDGNQYCSDITHIRQFGRYENGEWITTMAVLANGEPR